MDTLAFLKRRFFQVPGHAGPSRCLVPGAHCPASPSLQVLKALDSTWTTMEFEHEPHPRTGIMMLKSDEVLVETLEDNQVQLQNLMMSKYLSHFLKEVTSWQQKLSTADSVIAIWFEVQRTWGHLESIFVGSEDIRAQLPEDSQRFDDIDKEFKVSAAASLPPGQFQRWLCWRSRAPDTLTVPFCPQALMEDAVKTPNVVEATNKPGLYNKLEALKKRWVCTSGWTRDSVAQEPGCWPGRGKNTPGHGFPRPAPGAGVPRPHPPRRPRGRQQQPYGLNCAPSHRGRPPTGPGAGGGWAQPVGGQNQAWAVNSRLGVSGSQSTCQAGLEEAPLSPGPQRPRPPSP